VLDDSTDRLLLEGPLVVNRNHCQIVLTNRWERTVTLQFYRRHHQSLDDSDTILTLSPVTITTHANHLTTLSGYDHPTRHFTLFSHSHILAHTSRQTGNLSVSLSLSLFLSFAMVVRLTDTFLSFSLTSLSASLSFSLMNPTQPSLSSSLCYPSSPTHLPCHSPPKPTPEESCLSNRPIGGLVGWLVQDVQQDSSYNGTIILVVVVVVFVVIVIIIIIIIAVATHGVRDIL